MTEAQFDIGVIGGGPGGYVAAIRAAQLGARVALVEQERLGGVCMNRGCIPTKAMTSTVELLMEIENAGDFGILVSEPNLDFSRMMARKDQVVARLVSGVEELMEARKVQVIIAHGELISPNKIRVLGPSPIELTAEKIILATGSLPGKPSVPGVDLPGVVTSDEILALHEPPLDLVIVGGGVIGVEFASIFNAIGTKVTIIEKLPNLLPPVDEELAHRCLQLLRRQGVDVLLSSPLTEIREGEGFLEVSHEGPAGQGSVRADTVLISTGRIPCSAGLNLEEVGVKTEKRAIVVDEHMTTSVSGVYAIGDVTGGWMLAHVASREGEVAAEHALGEDSVMDYRAVPCCVFSVPEIAGVGFTEQQLKEQGVPCTKSRFPFSASGRALAMGQTTGLVKMICRDGDGEILGLHIMGPHATDLIAEGALAIQSGARPEDIIRTIHGHPTLPEAVREAAMAQVGGSINAAC